MPRAVRPPAYLVHRGPDGRKRARTVLRFPDGTSKTYYLGPYGSAESYAEHERIIALWRAARLSNGTAAGQVETVAELCARFLVHAEKHYRRPDGSPSKEFAEYVNTTRPLLRLHGPTRIRDFGPVALETVQAAIASGEWLTDLERAERSESGRHARVCRRTTNQRVGRIKRVFKWGVSKELIPNEVYARLCTLTGIPAGRGLAVEHPEVMPVPEADLDATLAVLSPVVRAMVLFQLHTGARPGEIVGIRTGDLDRSGRVDLGRGIVIPTGKVWVYRPVTHKTAHRGAKRVIFIGPKAQQVLAPFFGSPEFDPMFSPRIARVPSKNGRKVPGKCYTVSSYDRAITRACAAAGVPRWHPHQLRHNAASRLVAEFGWDVARVVLGHKSLAATRIYAVDNLMAAARAIETMG